MAGLVEGATTHVKGDVEEASEATTPLEASGQQPWAAGQSASGDAGQIVHQHASPRAVRVLPRKENRKGVQRGRCLWPPRVAHACQ
ncbi:hypothetical protein L7F22_037385 [Adiantum nelumboides]|nr:hypothetical protein [Adiantum nelumboides]